ncbi:MAG: hypothetical protein E6Q06_03675 [Candidatus Moraniibacteriota bacterium]|nr:MAG: hypothetical protein E6Q06_03675 [Candidatus Moranbacteria bacterium]
MRSRTDSRSGKTAPAPLEKNFREIVVGSGRSQEPYIIAFHYASDNVSGQSLGTLFGFFEVEIHDADAAYIVNFLASVAKKEYFANPRRSAVESFETALHKINVALAEIVKHGNVSWLGHLHGALGAVSQNTLNFSVTGEGEIYLARNETLRSISEGLADTESEPHPLKTFTEVSSGELFDGDLVFALSPAVWSLFSPEDLRRSLNRLGPAGFEQFLRTALVNELPVAAVALITCSAPVELQRSKEVKAVPAKPSPALDNVWSDAPFNAAREAKQSVKAAIDAAPSVEEKRGGYTDQKTGHIYVQASPDEAFEPADNHWKERWMLFQHGFETRLRAWNIASRKASRRIGKESALAFGAAGARLSLLRRAAARKARSLKRTFEENQAAKRRAKEEAERVRAVEALLRQPEPEAKPIITAPAETIERAAATSIPSEESDLATPASDRVRRFFQREAQPEMTFGTEAKERLNEFGKHLDRLRPALSASTQRINSAVRGRADQIRRVALFLASWVSGLWQALSPKEKWSVIGVASIVAAIGIIAIIRTEDAPLAIQDAPATPEEKPVTTVFPPADEPLATLLSGNRIVFPTNNSRSVVLATINDAAILCTERAVVNLTTQKSVTTPEKLRLAAGMDDLDAIFAVGESDTLYLWSAVTEKFEKNTLPLPTGANISAIGTYLTYLYVLDQKSGAIYRFPRAEGGFGTATTWSKESVKTDESPAFAVYENILVSDDAGKPALYTRGRNANVAFSMPKTSLSTDALAFDTRSGDIIALDRQEKRIIRWSATGTLLGQYYHESFGDIETLSVSADGSELLVSKQGATTAWRIQ